jgi:diguanylate cyclase (GGDEF)-like protein
MARSRVNRLALCLVTGVVIVSAGIGLEFSQAVGRVPAALSGPSLWLPWLIYGLFSLGLGVVLLLLFRSLDSQTQLTRLNAELTRVSRIDSLTGLPNRRFLDEALLAATSAAERSNEPMTVLLLDIDHFKEVNDTAGHAAGDKVLQELASRLRDRVRSDESVGRWGGEQFLVIMPGTDADAALAGAERLRDCVAGAPVDTVDSSVAVTMSIGVASSVIGPPDEVLMRAGAALHQAKERGRDCVVADRTHLVPAMPRAADQRRRRSPVAPPRGTATGLA